MVDRLDLERRGDWETALSEYLASRMQAEHSYGEHDCSLFAASAVEAMTGVDPAAEFRGRYSTRLGSLRALREIGAGTLEETMDAKFPEQPIGFARRGDLAFSDGNVGVVAGSFALFVGEEEGEPGLVKIPRAEWDKAWAVG